MNDQHVHCHECGGQILTQIKCAGGKTKPAEIHVAEIPWPMPSPDGRALGFIPRRVWLCDDCSEAIEKARAEAAAAPTSRLVVAQPGELRNVLADVRGNNG